MRCGGTLDFEVAIVPTFLSVTASEMPHDQLRQVLAEYLELEQAQIFRHLLVVRCGLMATIALLAALSTHALSVTAWSIMIGLILAAPIGAWIVELRCEWRLARRLNSHTRMHVTDQSDD
jgi:hypothetical protein